VCGGEWVPAGVAIVLEFGTRFPPVTVMGDARVEEINVK
uniref:Uncharacterized protein n=1 Tax=Anopheles dirus TaxID=7168 RepID=A0A182NXT7_9DIPT